MLSEDQVPESTYNLTLVPLDVPGAMISVTTSLSPSMQAKRETSLDKQNYENVGPLPVRRTGSNGSKTRRS